MVVRENKSTSSLSQTAYPYCYRFSWSLIIKIIILRKWKRHISRHLNLAIWKKRTKTLAFFKNTIILFVFLPNLAIIPREIETIPCKLLKGRQRVVRYFWKKAYWIKDLLLVFWQKRKLTEKIISNNEGYINGDGLSKSVFWVTQIGQKWGIQTIYSKIWAKKLPSNEKSPLTVDVRVIDRKQNLFA